MIIILGAIILFLVICAWIAGFVYMLKIPNRPKCLTKKGKV